MLRLCPVILAKRRCCGRRAAGRAAYDSSLSVGEWDVPAGYRCPQSTEAASAASRLTDRACPAPIALPLRRFLRIVNEQTQTAVVSSLRRCLVIASGPTRAPPWLDSGLAETGHIFSAQLPARISRARRMPYACAAAAASRRGRLSKLHPLDHMPRSHARSEARAILPLPRAGIAATAWPSDPTRQPVLRRGASSRPSRHQPAMRRLIAQAPSPAYQHRRARTAYPPSGDCMQRGFEGISCTGLATPSCSCDHHLPPPSAVGSYRQLPAASVAARF
eukprot:358296-Chlamydomonas_euryale.AAC.4